MFINFALHLLSKYQHQPIKRPYKLTTVSPLHNHLKSVQSMPRLPSTNDKQASTHAVCWTWFTERKKKIKTTHQLHNSTVEEQNPLFNGEKNSKAETANHTLPSLLLKLSVNQSTILSMRSHLCKCEFTACSFLFLTRDVSMNAARIHSYCRILNYIPPLLVFYDIHTNLPVIFCQTFQSGWFSVWLWPPTQLWERTWLWAEPRDRNSCSNVRVYWKKLKVVLYSPDVGRKHLKMCYKHNINVSVKSPQNYN